MFGKSGTQGWVQVASGAQGLGAAAGGAAVVEPGEEEA